jgi:hypothetical protein
MDLSRDRLGNGWSLYNTFKKHVPQFLYWLLLLQRFRPQILAIFRDSQDLRSKHVKAIIYQWNQCATCWHKVLYIYIYIYEIRYSCKESLQYIIWLRLCGDTTPYVKKVKEMRATKNEKLEGNRKVHNEELRAVYCWPVVVQKLKSSIILRPFSAYVRDEILIYLSLSKTLTC